MYLCYVIVVDVVSTRDRRQGGWAKVRPIARALAVVEVNQVTRSNDRQSAAWRFVTDAYLIASVIRSAQGVEAGLL